MPVAFARADLVGRYGRRAMDHALARGELVRVARGYYAGPAHADSMWTSASALAQSVGPRALISGRAGLFLHGAIMDPPPYVTVAAPAERHPRIAPPGVRLLRTELAVQGEFVRELPVASPAFSLFHAVREVTPERAFALALEALATAVEPADLSDILRTTRRAPRRAVLRRALAAFDDGVRSILEYRALTDVLYGPEFAHLSRQRPVAVDGRVFVLDAFDARASVAFEFDGRRYHSGSRWESDRERDTLLASVGILTVRFTFRDVTERPAWCRAMALRVLESRRAA